MSVSREEFEALARTVEAQRQLIEQQQAVIQRLAGEASGAQVEAVSPALSRRGLFAGVAAAAAGAVAGLAGGTGKAEAATGDALVAGSYYNQANHPTSLTFTGGANYQDYAFGVNDGPTASYLNGHGGTIAANVQGSFTAAIYAENLRPKTTTAGRDLAAIYGTSENNSGVIGTSRKGAGIYGASTSGIGVRAQNTSAGGIAFQAEGVTRFKRSGQATVQAGKREVEVTIPPINLSTPDRLFSSSLVLATLQAVSGNLAILGIKRGTNPAKFKIALNGPAPAGGIKVGWFIIDMIQEG